jgi:hypothetical protein
MISWKNLSIILLISNDVAVYTKKYAHISMVKDPIVGTTVRSYFPTVMQEKTITTN